MTLAGVTGSWQWRQVRTVSSGCPQSWANPTTGLLTAHRSPHSRSAVMSGNCLLTYRPIAAAGCSAVCQRRSSAPGAHVEWVPLEMRSGSRNWQTGPSATRAASKTRQ